MSKSETIERIGAGLGLALLLAQSVFAQGQNPGPMGPVEKVAAAKPGDLRIMATGAIRGPLQSVRAAAEKAVGRPLVIEYGSARGNLQEAILAGQEFEVAILLPDVNKELLARDKILPQPRAIAHAPVAIALRGDVPAPDVSTPQALKKALLGAKSVRYWPTGAARDTVDKILGTLGIAGAINDSSRSPPTAAVALAPGEYEINIYPLSEILSDQRVKNLGLVPEPLQVPATIEAAIGKQANDVQAAKALIDFLAGPALDAALAKDGMTK